MAEEFEHILNECIERVLQGECLDECLKRYPGQAARLEPLLQVAIATYQAASTEPGAEYKLRARQQMTSVLSRQMSNAQPGKMGPIGKVKSGIYVLMGILKERTVFEKAMAGALVIALIVGLSLYIPTLDNQSHSALAEEIAAEDPGVQVLLEEEGLNADNMQRTVVKSEDEKNIYCVHFINTRDGQTVGIVTVDIERKIVTYIRMIDSSELFTRPEDSEVEISKEAIITLIRNDPRIQNLLDSGVQVEKITLLFSSLRKVVALELRLGDKVWFVKYDLIEGEVLEVFSLSELQSDSVSLQEDSSVNNIE